ncbi:helix-turn-helix transcriptional regulator [Burkholderia ubonensis]|uniref:helix-turn-helix transcriptional regulator n=1 Tax=Burkholderia ubonensis TaxID=101571 RepID=UPI0009B2F177|nr:AlpA family phage regulatory protein [Burkholderia ubonensis]
MTLVIKFVYAWPIVCTKGLLHIIDSLLFVLTKPPRRQGVDGIGLEVTSVLKICFSLKEVAEALSLSPATVQKLVREKTFPEPRLLSGRRVGWLVHEVQAWADTRPVANLLPPENTAARRR